MAEKSLEDRARQISQSRLQQGKEFEQLQAAQNQLLEINAAQKQNLGEQAMINSSVAAQNQLLAQAAEVGAMSVGGMRVNPATQATMNRYGLAKPTTISTSKQTVTKQNITINNNTTNINNVPANIGGPIQGRGIQFKDPAGEDGGMSKFRNWLQSAFTKQKEDEVKRNREYARRETSLSKSSNRIMRKLEDFSRDITKRLDPRNISKPIADHFSTVLKLLGMGYLATHTGKILDSIQSFQDKTKALWNWISGKEGATRPEFLEKISRGISNSLGRAFLGNKWDSTYSEKGILWALYHADDGNGKTKGILNQLFDDIKDKIAERNDKAKQYVGSLGDKLKGLNSADKITEILRNVMNYISILIGGDAAVGNVIQSDIQHSADTGNKRKGKQNREDNINDRVYTKAKRFYHDKDSDMDGVGMEMISENINAGASSYMTNQSFEGGINNGATNTKKYGDKLGVYRLTEAFDSKGRLRDHTTAHLSIVSDLQAYMEDGGDNFARINDDLRKMKQYLNTHDGPILANPETLSRILGLKGKDRIIGEDWITVYRDSEIYEKPDSTREMSKAASGYISGYIGKTVFGGAISGLGGIGALMICSSAAGPVGWVLVGVSALGMLATSPKLRGALGGAGLLNSSQKRRDLNTDYVKPTKEAMRDFWRRYGDYVVSFKLPSRDVKWAKENNLNIAEEKDHGVELGVNVGVPPGAWTDLIEDVIPVDDGEGHTIYSIKVNKDFLSLIDDRYLDAIILGSKTGHILTAKMAEVNKEMYQRIADVSTGISGYSPDLSTENLPNLIAAAQANPESVTWRKQVENLASASDELGRNVADKFMALEGSTHKNSGERKEWRQTKQEAHNQNSAASNVIRDLGNKNKSGKVTRGGEGTGMFNATYTSTGTIPAANNTGIPPLDLESTITSLVSHAQPDSTGWCARHVRSALEDGGMDTTGRPSYGGSYGSWLTQNGWEEVTGDSVQVGDIAVTSPFGSHKYGHISMLSPIGNGEYKWVADFASNNASPYRDDDGSHTKIYRYKNIINGNISSLPIFGAKGAYSGESKYKGANDVQHKEGGGVVDFLTSAINKAWHGSIKTIKTAAVDPYAPSQSWVDSVNGIPLNSSIAPRSLSDETKSTISSYFKGSNVAPSWATRANLTGSALKWSKLFNEEGKFLGDMTKLDPEVKTIIEGIQSATEKIASNTDEDKEIAKQQLLTSAAIGESTLAAADANSKMTTTAMRTLIANKNSSQPQAISGQESNI